MSTTINILIADPDPQFTAEISSELAFVKEIDAVGSAAAWDEVERLALAAVRPDVILFGPGWAKARVLSGFEQLHRRDPGLAAVLVTAEYSTELRRQAAQIGFAGVFGIPIDGAELLLALRRIGANCTGESGARPRTDARFITVFSTKGGVGKTVIATNLAVALADMNGAHPVIVDLDLQFGDVGVMLKLLPKHTLHDLVGLKSIDLGQIKALLTTFNDRVSAFVAPLQPELADLLTPDIIQPVYSWLRQAADYIIVDTPPCFNDNVLSVLDETDELLLVATLDLPSLKNIKLCLQTLKLLGFPKEKTRLVLNRVDRNLGLSVTDVEEVFQENVSIQIPNDPAVPLAVNKGVPVVLDAPKSPAACALMKLAGTLGGERTCVDKQKEVTTGVLA